MYDWNEQKDSLYYQTSNSSPTITPIIIDKISAKIVFGHLRNFLQADEVKAQYLMVIFIQIYFL